MADNTGLFGDGMMGGYGNNITAANIIRSRVKQPLYQAAMENADTGSIRATPPTPFESWLNESGQRLMNPTDTIAQGVQDFTGQSDTELASSLMGGGLGTFAGVGAKNADRAAYNIASKMKQAGVADREIHAQTGWTFGFPDGKPRFEIDDSAAKTGLVFLDKPKQIDSAFKHNDLYSAYPELGKTQFTYAPASSMRGFNGNFDPKGGFDGSPAMQVSQSVGLDNSFNSTMLHELQHAVQEQEGFARGGSPQMFMRGYQNKLKDLNSQVTDINQQMRSASGTPQYDELMNARSGIVKQIQAIEGREGLGALEAANKDYRSLAGEAEARLTQARMNMTQAERAASYPPSMFDVPVDQQIVRFGDGPAMSTNTNNQPLVNALRKPTAGELAHKLAHDRAMLPVSEHGLGLPAGNTAMDRANVMFPKDVYHSTDADILTINPSAGGKLGPGVYTSDSPDYVNKYILPRPNKYVEGGNVMPLRIKDNLASPDTAELARQDTSHLGTPPDVKNYKTYWKQQVNDELANRGYSGRTIDGPIYDGMENVTFNPDDIRSRFAAFDPWRRNAAIAALTGTAAPDLMAGENDNLVNALRSK